MGDGKLGTTQACKGAQDTFCLGSAGPWACDLTNDTQMRGFVYRAGLESLSPSPSPPLTPGVHLTLWRLLRMLNHISCACVTHLTTMTAC